ncbi:hypothetical protein GLOIN_2v1878708 [Rhizophagus irregularis DAOM 181602=DAOM 197198]|nr:hypothetical protein GLOIN_2v1878708 [Rhizophagus irregularis DAOM 181602=DAOM 197198]
MPRMRSKELPGLRNGRLRREVSGELNFFYLRTFTNVLFLFFYYRELPGLRNERLRQEGLRNGCLRQEGLRNGRLRQEGMLPEVFYIKMFIIIPFFCRNAV